MNKQPNGAWPEANPMIEDNTLRNKLHYDRTYSGVRVERILEHIRNLPQFLNDATKTDTSWYGLYYGGLQGRLKGRHVLELGAGDGLNALVMAALGAHVTAIDISYVTPDIISRAVGEIPLAGSIAALSGDFLAMNCFDACSFDLVVGKAFLHHLDHETEAHFLFKAANLFEARWRSSVLRTCGEQPSVGYAEMVDAGPGAAIVS